MLWVKAFHIMSVIAWFATIFYLPRLFVYHAMSEDQTSRERFQVMERKLFNGMMLPTSVAVIVSGLWMLSYGFWGNWMILKLILVALVLIYQAWCYYTMQQFRQKKVTHSHRYYRVMNELPVLLMVSIVILVVVKPF